MRYSNERKEAILKKMLPAHKKSIPVLAREEGISEPTPYGWRAAAQAEKVLSETLPWECRET